MSDEAPRPDAVAVTPRVGGIYEHYCQHEGCKKWGGFGYAVAKDVPPNWYCWEHRPE